MTIYSGKTRISEEEDLWRVIGIHEVTNATDDDRQIISGYMESETVDNVTQYLDFYTKLDYEPDIYYDLLATDLKEDYRYIYKYGNDYDIYNFIEGYYTANAFYVGEIEPDNLIYYDIDKDEYFLYENQYESYRNITKYPDKLYYHNGEMYRNKADVGSNVIALLVNDEYEQHPYIEGSLINNTFYSDEVTFDSDSLYYDVYSEIYYFYDSENEVLSEAEYEYISEPNQNNQVTCLPIGANETETKTKVTGYKVRNRFFETVSAGYIDPILLDGTTDNENVYHDQLTGAYYFRYANEYVQMPYYEQLEVVGNVLYFHHYESEDDKVYHKIIIEGYYVNGGFYTDRLNGDSTAIYHISGTADTYFKYNSQNNSFDLYEMTTSYEIGTLYSGKITNPSSNVFYEDFNDNLYYYNGSYQLIGLDNGYYIPIKDIMCKDKIDDFYTEYLYKSDNDYYIYKEDLHNLVKTNPVSCYFINSIPYQKQRPAMGAIYYDTENDEYFIYKNGTFEIYNNTPLISDGSQIVLSLTKQDLLLDDDIFDQNPYDEDVVLEGATTTRAGLMTADLYNRFIDLENRYKMRISPSTYETLADLEEDAPTEENMIYIVGESEQYVLSDNGTYVKIGDTDLSTLDFKDVANVDDISDILEQINTGSANIQGQLASLRTDINSKYPTANIITNANNISNPTYDNEAVSSKALVDYVTSQLSGANGNNVVRETVVYDVQKIEDSIRVYTKEIVTAMPYDYINSLPSSNIDANHTFSARLIRELITDLQTQIDNVVDDGLILDWRYNDESDATIILSIENRVI